MCKAVNFLLYRLSRIRKFLSPDALKTAVHSLIASKLDYCNSVLVGLPRTQINKFLHIMNCSARLISGIGKFDHVTPALKSLHWLPSEARIQYKVLCLVYKTQNGLAPKYLCDAVASYKPARALHSSDKGLLVIPKVHTREYGGRAFVHAGPSLFNALPSDVRLAPSFDILKSRLKIHIFRISYTT